LPIVPAIVPQCSEECSEQCDHTIDAPKEEAVDTVHKCGKTARQYTDRRAIYEGFVPTLYGLYLIDELLVEQAAEKLRLRIRVSL
jgi:hypothetical protein